MLGSSTLCVLAWSTPLLRAPTNVVRHAAVVMMGPGFGPDRRGEARYTSATVYNPNDPYNPLGKATQEYSHMFQPRPGPPHGPPPPEFYPEGMPPPYDGPMAAPGMGPYPEYYEGPRRAPRKRGPGNSGTIYDPNDAHDPFGKAERRTTSMQGAVVGPTPPPPMGAGARQAMVTGNGLGGTSNTTSLNRGGVAPTVAAPGMNRGAYPPPRAAPYPPMGGAPPPARMPGRPGEMPG